MLLLAAVILGAGYLRSSIATSAVRRQRIAELEDANAANFREIATRIGHVSQDELDAYPLATHPRIHVRAWLSSRIADESALSSDQLTEAADLLAVADSLELRNLMAILRRDKDAACDKLTREFTEPHESYKTKVRICAALLLLGRVDEPNEIVGPGTNPSMRSRLTLLLSKWVEDWEAIFDLVERSNASGSLRSVIVDAASEAWNGIPKEMGDRLRNRCHGLLGEGNTSGVFHALSTNFASSLIHLLEQDGAFELPAGAEAADKSWFTNALGIRFVRLSMDPASQYYNVFLADREISNDLIREFGRHAGKEFGVKTEPGSKPAHAVSLYTVAAFCDWMSGMEGREPCFGEGVNLENKSGGYRVPTFDELLVAGTGLAGTGAGSHCSNSVVEQELFSLYEAFRYGVQGGEAGGVLGLDPGSRLPNSAGFFDVLRNVAEWTVSKSPGGKFRIFGDDAYAKIFLLTNPQALNRSMSPLLNVERVRRVGFRLAIELKPDLSE